MPEEIVLRFRTESDLRAGEAAQKHIAAALKAVKEGTPAYAALKVQLDAVNTALNGQGAAAVKAASELQRAVDAVKAGGGNASGLQAQLNSLRWANNLKAPGMVAGAADMLSNVPGMGGMARFATGPAGAAAGVLAGAGLAIKEYAEAEEGVAKLDAAMAQNGILIESNRQKYQALAGEMQSLTGVADDQWIAALTRLTQMGSRPETIGMDVEAVKNLAGLVGDVGTAANMYSKALQGNFEMFGRYGIVITDAGTKTEKLQRLQEQLAQKGGGQLEASAKTLSGQYRVLKNATSDVFEAMGRGLSQTGVGQSVLYGLATSAEWLASKLGGVIPAADGMANKLGSMAKTAAEAEAAAKTLKEQEDALKKSFEDAAASLDKELAAIDRNLAAKQEMIELNARVARSEIELTIEDPEEKAQALAVLNAVTEREKEAAQLQGTRDKKAKVQKNVQEREKAVGVVGVEKQTIENELKKSRELDEAGQPEVQARAEFKAQAEKVMGIRRKIGEAAERGGIGGAGLFDELKDAEDDLKRKQRAIAPAAAASAEARKNAGVTKTTAELEAALAAKEKELAQRKKERDDNAPKDAEAVANLEREEEFQRAANRVREKARVREVRAKTGQRGLPPEPTQRRDDPRTDEEKQADAKRQAEAVRARRLEVLRKSGLPENYDDLPKDQQGAAWKNRPSAGGGPPMASAGADVDAAAKQFATVAAKNATTIQQGFDTLTNALVASHSAQSAARDKMNTELRLLISQGKDRQS